MKMEISLTKPQSNFMKLIAITAMLIDHIGVILFPQYILFRVIGRIAFPLFAYQIGIGYQFTRNIKRYILRLFLFGVGIQLFYFLFSAFTGEDPFYLNIFFTLFFGLAAIFCYSTKRYVLLSAVIAVPLLSPLAGVTFDYGVCGVLLILGLYAAKGNLIKIALVIVVLAAANSYLLGWSVQLFSIAALLFIIKPFPLKMKIPSGAFYVFYPLHLAVLYLIDTLRRL